jgi:hypothetical protein
MLMLVGLMQCSMINEIDLSQLLSLFNKAHSHDMIEQNTTGTTTATKLMNEGVIRKENELRRDLPCFFEAQCALECVKYIECVRYAFRADTSLCSLFIVAGGKKPNEDAVAASAQLDKAISCDLKACSSSAGIYCSSTSGCLCEDGAACNSKPKYEFSEWV